MTIQEKILELVNRGYRIIEIRPGYVEIYADEYLMADTREGPNFVVPHVDFELLCNRTGYLQIRKKFLHDMDELHIPFFGEGGREDAEKIVESFLDFWEKQLEGARL